MGGLADPDYAVILDTKNGMESSKFDSHSSIVFVFIGSLPVSDSLLPLAVVDVAVGVSVLPFAVLLIFGILALIFETVGLKSKMRLGSMSLMKSRFGQCSRLVHYFKRVVCTFEK